jgi:hypothetical protein
MLIFVVQQKSLTELLDHLGKLGGGGKSEMKRADIVCNIPTGIFLGVTEEVLEIFSQNVFAAS